MRPLAGVTSSVAGRYMSRRRGLVHVTRASVALLPNCTSSSSAAVAYFSSDCSSLLVLLAAAAPLPTSSSHSPPRSPTFAAFAAADPIADTMEPSSPGIKVGVGAIVCEEAVLKGDITIGPRTVVHPRASIIAEAGPIIIGEGNIIEEMATIVNRISTDQSVTPVQIIGNYNVFEVDSTCEASKVGDNNILECKAFVSKEVELTTGCIIGTACSLTEQEIVPENTIIYGSQCERREMNDKPYPQIGQLDYLMKILPNYHHIYKPNIKPVKSEPSA